MPELPEVETIKRGLEQRIVGLRITGVDYDVAKMLRPNPETLTAGVRGAKVIKVGRRAKMPLVYLNNTGILVFHLKLNGQLLFRKSADPPDKYVHVIFSFAGGKELRFSELRKFGWVKLVDNEASLTAEFADLGPEPFSEAFDGEYLEKILSKTGRAVKVVLMDQRQLAGVGNIYATEALFYAGIAPQRPARNLTHREVGRLYEEILSVLREGLKYGGATDRDQAYRQVTGEPGHFQEHFAVYGREGKPCKRCGTPIRRIKIGGRGTYFCPQCQQ
jgi:formamidopyrimidine-DNA glycosylase